MARVASLLLLVFGGGACLDWDSLYGDPPSDAAPDVASVDRACSDGTREALAGFSSIAACGGAWSVIGVVADTAPACDRAAGNTGANAAGTGCNAADLCAVGFHVCRNREDVNEHDGVAACAQLASRAGELYITRTRGDRTTLTCAIGASTMADDVYGCGGLGAAVTGCGPINHKLSLSLNCPSPWKCGTGELEEGAHVFATAATAGGVLCCQD